MWTTLATLGRNGDVFVEAGSSISKMARSNEPITKVVMFDDKSRNQTSQYGRTRKVVVQHDANTIIGMGLI
jgi:hypothetical protein